MGPINVHREEELLVAERAADWLRRLETGNAADNAAFMAWLKESPRHVREILLLVTWDKVLSHCDPQQLIDVERLHGDRAQNVVELPPREASHHRAPVMRRAIIRWRWAAGIAVVFVSLLLAVCLRWNLFDPMLGIYATGTGEQRTVTLSDGSVIQLDTRSRLRAHYSASARDIYLLDGQAFFTVAHDARWPFRVHAGDAVIQAVGTQFDVYRRTGLTAVSVVEGTVRVQGDAVQVLTAGEATNVVTGGHLTPRRTIDAGEITAWRHHRLVFRKDTLADIAAEFNRYNRRPQIHIESEAVRARQFNGVFNADDPWPLIEFLSRDPGLTVERKRDEIVIRPKGSSSE